MKTPVRSYDVFDTCLVRYFARPVHLFQALGKKVMERMPSPCHEEQIEEMARLRVEAEKKARHLLKQEDVTLQDIYNHLVLPEWAPFSPYEMMQAEIRIEMESVYPVEYVRGKIREDRQAGNRIVFISDMYLPSEAIGRMLTRHGIMESGDGLYVSGEIGLTKKSGHLFEYVLSRENIEPCQMTHLGDHPESDFRVPKRLNIKASLFRESALNFREESILAEGHRPLLDSLMSGIGRVVRLSFPNRRWPILPSIFSGVIAPLLCSFVSWVLKEAREQGVERLYFVSRDGQILLKIAQAMGKYLPVPECRYLYGSRQAWYLPSLFEGRREELDWLVLPGHSKALEHVLKKLEIAPEEIAPGLKRYGLSETKRQMEPEEIEAMWQMLEDSQVASRVLEKARKARERTVSYFKAEGLFDDVSWAIVDIGWTLKTQRALRRILCRAGAPRPGFGYYFGVRRERIGLQEAGPYRAFLLQEYPKPPYPFPLGEHPFRYATIIEQLFTMCDHASVLTYGEREGKIAPVFKDRTVGPEKREWVEALHRSVSFYAELALKTEVLPERWEALGENGMRRMKEFFTTPRRKEVETLGWISLGDDQNESRSHPLAKKLGILDILALSGYVMRRMRYGNPDYLPRYAWLEGCVSLSAPWTRALFWLARFLRLRFGRLVCAIFERT